jgi:hypothetical protein
MTGIDSGLQVFGGFLSLFGMLFFFLAVIWFIMPFVVLGIKGRLDRALDLLESLDRRLAALERHVPAPPVSPHDTPPSAAPPPDRPA